MADPASRPHFATLPDSEEAKYRKKCKDLKRRIREIEDNNEGLVVKLARTKRHIQRLRLERSFLLETLEDKTPKHNADSDGSPSPPRSPPLERYVPTFDRGTMHNNGAKLSPDPPKFTPVRFHEKAIEEERTNLLPSDQLGGLAATSIETTPAAPTAKAKKPPRDPHAPKR